MLSSMVVFGFLLCCPFFLMFVEQGEAAVVTDANPSEYPYVVRFHAFTTLPPADSTMPGMVVSSRFVLILTPEVAFRLSNFTITDQYGVVRTPVSNGSIVDDQFTYFKVCRKFGGATYPLRESDFNNLTTAIPNAQLIFFNATSPVLKKMTVPVMNQIDCANATDSAPATLTDICVDSSGFTDLCPIFINQSPEKIEMWLPMLAIGGQVQGLPSNTGCNEPYWPANNIAVFRQNLTSEIPEVDIV